MTYNNFLKLNPRWPQDETKVKQLKRYGTQQEDWTALDVLRLSEEEASWKDKLWAVLREEFIPAKMLHEFACRCAEAALRLIDDPDPRSVAAIAAKRAWSRGEITDAELAAARVAARDAAWAAAWAAAEEAAREKQGKMLIQMLETEEA